ncbi:MAG TPA: hypothetical protein VKD23_11450 [Terriglobales bacterium]|nr:hypothetical protein [Terriglobales bacterium]
MQLVEIKGVTKRVRKKVVLTVEQYQAPPAELPYHIQVMVMIAMCLGLRISEIRALQWADFDLKGQILTLPRSNVGRYVWNGGKPELQRTKCFCVGKTTTLSVIREGAEAEGYRVEGLTATTGQRGDVSRSPSEIRRTVKIVKFLTGLRGVATPPLSNQSPKLFKIEPSLHRIYIIIWCRQPCQ